MYMGRDGYYDDNGHWQRLKRCFMSCGDRCTCMPPNGRYYSEEHDINKIKKKEPKPDDPMRGISLENVRR